ncbi:hypothetical protein [Mucilaginibacter sp. UR6-11]|uniref:hypothetical protein n=1 Tax=Mucilaginibacter sp. UR6-11 TaxID=1435644 RepID=UPI001E44C465|nr:hypothetical protein [Mucilaginibacter sp. UR6-11]MCC8424439.1 hypothetical protein [Mucilaginibacter sp. UR6-11]
MLVDDEETNRNYKIHCLEIAMSELQNEMQGYKERLKEFMFLREDFHEIIENKDKHPSRIFLLKRYF